ncbi:hypothetical protein EIP91_004921, partial [Steccherinum ochraceum]
ATSSSTLSAPPSPALQAAGCFHAPFEKLRSCFASLLHAIYPFPAVRATAAFLGPGAKTVLQTLQSCRVPDVCDASSIAFVIRSNMVVDVQERVEILDMSALHVAYTSVVTTLVRPHLDPSSPTFHLVASLSGASQPGSGLNLAINTPTPRFVTGLVASRIVRTTHARPFQSTPFKASCAAVGRLAITLVVPRTPHTSQSGYDTPACGTPSLAVRTMVPT